MKHAFVLLLLLSPAALSQPRTFGTLVLVEAEAVPAGPSPLSARTAAEWRFVEMVYAPLFMSDGAAGYEPVAASTVTVENGGKVLRVALKDGVQWSVGRDITGVDIVYTYELARAGKWNGAWVDLLRAIVSVERSSDGFGAVITLSEPVKQPESLLVVPLLPSGIHGPLNEPNRQRPLPLGTIGAGPFRVAVEGDPSRLAANALAPRPAKISEVRVLSVGSPVVAAETVRLVGDAVTFHLAPRDAAIAQLELTGRRLDNTRTRLEVLAFDPKASALGEPGVRDALDAVLDRGELFAPGEGGRPGSAPVSRRSPLYPKDRAASARSAERAAGLLSAAGWTREPGKNATKATGAGLPQELQIPLLLDGDDPNALRRAAVIRARCSEVGIDVQLDARPRIEFHDRIASRQFPAALISLEGGNDDQLRALFRTRGALNELGWSVPEVDTALDAGDLPGAVANILKSVPALFLGVKSDVGAVGKNVVAPQVFGRGGLQRVDKWQIR